MIKSLTRLCNQTLLVSIFLACNNHQSHNIYSIYDFRQELRPYLLTVVEENYVAPRSAEKEIEKIATSDDLVNLGKSEHPNLRAIGIKLIMKRTKANPSSILAKYLDDSAAIYADRGEWGLVRTTVSDFLIGETVFSSKAEKQKMIRLVLTKYNYLRSAYLVLDELNAEPEYYEFIRHMAQQKRSYDELERAVAALARYKNEKDIALIKTLMEQNIYYLGWHSFNIIEKSADSAYFPVLEEYLKRPFYRYISLENSIDNAKYFIGALSIYKNKRSAIMLQGILTNGASILKPFYNLEIRSKIVDAVIENNCVEYMPLLKQMSAEIDKRKSEQHELVVVQQQLVGPKEIRW